MNPSIEKHPLKPFLPEEARLLMLGSFPPPRARWSMEFFYPNWINDMWRIVGTIFFGQPSHFELRTERRFDHERIEAFCRERGIALYDTACEVIRLKENASDNFLEVVRESDVEAMLRALPRCHDLATTGQKATETLCHRLGCTPPPVGGWVECHAAERAIRLWRMPSSSRAFPRSVEWKATYYREMFHRCGLL